MSVLVVLAILNVIVGTLIFNWAWKQIKPIREQDEARDSQFPPFRRTDLKKWSVVKFYLGAITLMPMRFVLGICINLVLFAIFK